MSAGAILLVCLAPCFGLLIWALAMAMKANQAYLHEDWANLSPSLRRLVVRLITAVFGLLAAVFLLAFALSGDLVAGVVAATILVILLRYVGLGGSQS